ncbi:response regulator [Saccharibacillus kuerlensis]|uniref:DNA-binding response regulator n=1 Tax=Saccharibacillus kuerlensis TaxID=459527 RepID=A0ABQ2KYN5_9BACL|nr:response regulator [Saccharibacillus kuerlensis]GGN94640.1 DNA-binding response regulator [Saccharibacillus kuerlensis]
MKVILIDDEPAMHLVVKRMLSKLANVEVTAVFSDTASAYAYLQTHEADLILLDIGMPKENGLEFAARLRAEDRQIRLVFLTSHKEYALEAFDVYAFDYLVKPVVREKLHRTVLRILSELTEPVQLPADPAPAGLTIRVLGGIEIRGEQEARAKWKSRKSAELFAYLLLQQGRYCSRDRLIDDLFGSMPQKNAETYLNTTAYQLRKLLEGFGRKGMLVSDNQHYALEIGAGDEVDLLNFENGCREVLAPTAKFDLQRALDVEKLYAGPLFGERDFVWASAERERVDQLYASFGRKLCEELLQRGNALAAAELSGRLIERNDLDETPRLLLLEALAMQKNRSGLARQYKDYTQTLRQELGVDPSPELKDRYRELMESLL